MQKMLEKPIEYTLELAFPAQVPRSIELFLLIDSVDISLKVHIFQFDNSSTLEDFPANI